METTAIGSGSTWSEPVGLPPELMLLAALAEHRTTQTGAAKLEVENAHQRLAELRDEIAEAMERAKEAQKDAGFWGDVSGVLGGDLATIAGVVASTAFIVGSGGSGTAVIVAALAVGFTAGGEVAEELGADPKVVMGLKLAGAAVSLLGGNAATASKFWGTVHTWAKVTQGAATAAGGGAHVVEGQYQGDAAEQRGQATYLRNTEQLQSQQTDEQIATIEKLVKQLRFLTETATTISAGRDAVDQSVIRRIGG